VWTEAQENAFQHLKSKLISRPILQYPDFSKEFILTTDASNSGLGAVLSQEPVGKGLPVAYASRRLNSAETHYTTRKKGTANYCVGYEIFSTISLRAKVQNSFF
jgi:hypothetical protein